MSISELPSIGTWTAQLAQTSETERTEVLADYQKRVRAAGGCGSLQTANGLPCRRPPKVGYPVCRKHGERAPQTVAKAERLLAIARMPAIEVLLDELDQYQEETCSLCGYPAHGLKERKHIAAISFKLLDRTGFGPRSTVDLNAKVIGEQTIDVSLLSDEEFEELRGLLAVMDQFKTKINARLAQDAAREVLAPVAQALLQS